MLSATKFEGVQSPRQPQMAEPARLKQILAIFEEAEVVEPSKKLSVCRDPHENKFFERAGRASSQKLPLEVRREMFALMRDAAAAHGIEVSICACQNRDLARGTCNITGR